MGNLTMTTIHTIPNQGNVPVNTTVVELDNSDAPRRLEASCERYELVMTQLVSSIHPCNSSLLGPLSHGEPTYDNITQNSKPRQRTSMSWMIAMPPRRLDASCEG